MKIIGVVVVAAVVGAATWMFFGPGARGTAVETALVQQGSIREFIEERGVTRLPREHLVTMPYSGRISSVELEEGDRVSADQVVARIVPLDLDLTVAEARAAVERLEASLAENDDATVEETTWRQAVEFVKSMVSTVGAARGRVTSGEAKWNYAQRNLARMQELSRTAARTADDLERAQLAEIEAQVDYQQDRLVLSAMESMQAATELLPTMVRQFIDRKQLTHAVLEKQKAEALARLRQAEENQQRGSMTSPVDGVVLERAVSNTRYLAAGAMLMRIGELDRLEVEVDVLSQDVVRVEEGDAVELYGPAIGDAPASGQVSRVFPAGFMKISSLGVEEQRVKVIVDFAPEDLRRLREERELGVGYRVSARIYTDERASTLVIPRSALFRGPQGDWRVFAVRDGRAVVATVELGLLNDQAAEITSGLAEGDAVVLAPESSLTDGARVSPISPVES